MTVTGFRFLALTSLALLTTLNPAFGECEFHPCIAVLDTGIDPSHPDFSSATVRFRDFTTPANEVPIDDFGHGTAVASRIVGSGRCAAGLVPEAEILAGKVNRPSEPDVVVLSAVIEGIEWAIAEGADVINLSLGGPDLGTGTYGVRSGRVIAGENALEVAIGAAARAGIVTVIAVGNTFVLSSELNTPANAVEALVVGAAAADGTPKALPLLLGTDAIGFNSRRDASFSDLDPHVTAVGTAELVMARASGTTLGAVAGDGSCIRAAGTSFSTPWTVGFVGLLKQYYAGGAVGGPLVEYLVRLVQYSADDSVYPYAFEGFGFVERASVLGRAMMHAEQGTLPPAPRENDSMRQISDELRRID